MNAYLIQTASPASYYPDPGNPPLFYSVIDTGTIGADTVLDILHPSDPTIPGDTLIGGWNQAGEQVAPLDLAKYEAIRPLGNEPPREIYDDDGNPVGTTKGGNATKQLKYHYFAGWGQRQLGDAGELYPGSNKPFPIIIARHYFEEDDPSHNGHGWVAEMDADFVPTTRSPEEYWIAIYTDPECRVEDFWFQTGGFKQAESFFQFDANENPRMVWQDYYNHAFQGQPDESPIYYGVCKGSIYAQEGYGTLELNEDSDQLLFWEYTQGVPHGTWQASGLHVSGQAGTVYIVDDVDLAAQLVDGEPIRYNGEEANETTFVELRPGFDDQILTDPFLEGHVGAEIWWLRAAATGVSTFRWSGNDYEINFNALQISFGVNGGGAYQQTLGLVAFLSSEAIEFDFRLAVWLVLKAAGLVYVPPTTANGWQDTGAVIDGKAGQLFYISDPDVAAALIPGEPIRLGLLETTFIQVWPGTSNLLQISPYIQASIGDKVYTK